MKILLTGHKGFIGSALLKRLQKNKAVRARKKQERIEREW